jgi:hypothetical protein
MSATGYNARPPSFTLFLAAFSAVAATIFAIVRNNGLSGTEPEMLLIYTLVAGAALIATGLEFLGLRFLAGLMVLAGGILWLDASFSKPASEWLGPIGSKPLRLAVDAILVTIVASAFLVMRRHYWTFSTIAAVLFVSLAVASIVTASGRLPALPFPKNPPVASLPPLVHIVFDEHAGITSLNQNPQLSAAKSKISEFFATRGFLTFENAFSRTDRTQISFPSFLNRIDPPERFDLSFAKLDPLVFGVHGDEYFRAIEKRGYRLTVAQTNFLNLCNGSSSSQRVCTTFPYKSLAYFTQARLPVQVRAALVSASILTQTRAYRMVKVAHRKVGEVLGTKIWWPKFVDSIAYGMIPMSGFYMLDQIATHLPTMRPGDALFAHVLLPHGPFNFDRNCTLRRPLLWRNDVEEISRAALARYAEQIECLYLRLESALPTEAVRDKIVIIQGDHGHRRVDTPPFVTNIDGLSKVDFIDSFSTIFAVAGPNIQRGNEVRPGTIDGILWSLVDRDFQFDRSVPLPLMDCKFFITESETDSSASLLPLPKVCGMPAPEPTFSR